MKKFFLEGGSPTLSVVEIAITKYRNCPNINRAIEKIEKNKVILHSASITFCARKQ